MFEPVWIGNYIVPRWEALAIVGGAFTLAAVISVLAIAVAVCVIRYTWKSR